MAKAFRLTAKKNIQFKGKGTVALAKGMSFDHVEQSHSAPVLQHVREALKQRFGAEVSIDTIPNCFEVKNL